MHKCKGKVYNKHVVLIGHDMFVDAKRKDLLLESTQHQYFA